MELVFIGEQLVIELSVRFVKDTKSKNVRAVVEAQLV